VSVRAQSWVTGLFFIMVLVLIVGCSPERAVVVDQEKFRQIESYLSEILPALEETVLDFDLWSKDMSDPEKKEWLQMNAQRVKEINNRYLTPDFAAYEEIETWFIPVEDGENTQWAIEGVELSAALQKLLPAGEETALLIEQIYRTEDQLLLTEKRDQLQIALDRALEAADLLRKMFRR